MSCFFLMSLQPVHKEFFNCRVYSLIINVNIGNDNATTNIRSSYIIEWILVYSQQY